jgi:hypothetical protein
MYRFALEWLLDQAKLLDDASIASKKCHNGKTKSCICENDENISGKQWCFIWMI